MINNGKTNNGHGRWELQECLNVQYPHTCVQRKLTITINVIFFIEKTSTPISFFPIQWPS